MSLPAPDNLTQPAAFYAVGGSLRTDCPSYVERAADRQLHNALTRHEFCYILTSRQMGKSSLMIRTVHRLRQEGTRAVVLDLTSIGSNLTAEQWYLGLLDRLGEQLQLEDALEDYWLAQGSRGPLQRWLGALREVALVRLSVPLVIFIDEIDAVRSLPFSTDEFFAAIRECYNRRATDAVYDRLTFCLLGVASPSDLIRDTRLTPFNIGRRIELGDFTPEEAALLAEGLGVGRSASGVGGNATPNAQHLLSRILYWTDGHPYLTQRLCQSVAERLATEHHSPLPPGVIRGPRSPNHIGPPHSLVDAVCSDLFLTSRARERDDNLLFVRERLLRSEVDLVTLLDTYGRVRQGRRVADEESNGVVTALRLSGAVKGVRGWLRVRNRIYGRVFDRVWVRENLPYAEVWRQQRAYRLGMLRTGFVSGIVVAVMAGLIWKTATESRHVQGLLAQSEEGHGLQMLDDDTSLGLLYLLEAQRIAPDQALPSQWAGWYGACSGWLVQTLVSGDNAHASAFTGDGMAFSDDGKRLVTWRQLPNSAGRIEPDSDGQMQIWDLDTGRMHGAAISIPGSIDRAVFSPDGSQIVTRSIRSKQRADGIYESEVTDVQIRNVETGQPHGSPLPMTGRVTVMQFSRDGRRLLTSDQTAVKLWDTATGRLIKTPWQGDPRDLAVLSPDGQKVAFQSENRLYLCRIDGTHLVTLADEVELIQQLAFSRDGKRLTAVWHSWQDRVHADFPGEIGLLMRQWDASSGQPVRSLWQKDAIKTLPGREGDWFVTVSRNRTVQKWDAATGQPIGSRIQLPGTYGDIPTGIVVSPDGTRLAATSFQDQKTLVWDMATGQPIGLPLQYHNQTEAVRFSPDGTRLALHDGILGVVRVWELAGGPPYRLPVKVKRGGGETITAFSPDGGCLAVYQSNKDVQLWDTRTGRRLGSPLPITHEANGKFNQGAYLVGIMRRPLQFSADGSRLAVMTGDITVCMVDAATGLPLGKPLIQQGYVRTCAFRPDGKQLAVGISKQQGSGVSGSIALEGAVQLWDTSTGQPVCPPLKSAFQVFGLAYNPDGKRLVAMSSEAKRQIWDLDTLRASEGADGSLSNMTHEPFAAFAPDGKTLATFSVEEGGQSCVRLWAAANGQKLQRTLTFQKIVPSEDPPVIGFSPDGRWLAATQHGYRDHNGLMLWNTADWQPTEVPLPEPYQIINAVYSPEGKWLALAAEDSTEVENGTGSGEWMVELMNLEDGRVNNQILQQHGQFMAIAFLPDGDLQVAAASHDSTRLWRLPTQPIANHAMELRTWLALGARLDRDKHVEMIPGVEWRRIQQELQTLQSRQAASSR